MPAQRDRPGTSLRAILRKLLFSAGSSACQLLEIMCVISDMPVSRLGNYLTKGIVWGASIENAELGYAVGKAAKVTIW